MPKLTLSLIMLISIGTCLAQSETKASHEPLGLFSLLLQLSSSGEIVFEDGFETIPPGLCSSCVTDDDCLAPSDQCLPLDGGYFCGQDCSAGNPHGIPAGVCPESYTCQFASEDGFQCVPDSNSCTCLPLNLGEQRECSDSNAYGTCEGLETCEPAAGWLACTAAIPELETCDGADNDCDMLIDENTCDDDVACTTDICDGQSCANVPSNSLCDDGLFCNGIEVCNVSGGCVAGPPPCPGPDGDGDCAESCDESGQNCTGNDPDTSICNDGDPCTTNDICMSGFCTSTPIVDAYENNDTRGNASILGSIEDGAEFPAGITTASLYEAGDMDWFRFHVTDTEFASSQPRVDLTNIPAGSNYQLCAYFECDDPGNNQDVQCTQGSRSIFDDLPGCCSTNAGSGSARVSFTAECDNSIFSDDTSGTVYVRIYNAIPAWSCDLYSLKWGDD